MDITNLEKLQSAWSTIDKKRQVVPDWSALPPEAQDDLTGKFGDKAKSVYSSLFEAVDVPIVKLYPISGMKHAEGEVGETEGDFIYHFYPRNEEFDSVPEFLECLTGALASIIPEEFHTDIDISFEESPETPEEAIDAFKKVPPRFRGRDTQIPRYWFKGPDGLAKKTAVSVIMHDIKTTNPILADSIELGVIVVLEERLAARARELARLSGPRPPSA
jgi:hypothetical protein